jgi:hypothetical protein
MAMILAAGGTFVVIAFLTHYSHSLCLIYHPWAFCYSWRGCFMGRDVKRWEDAKEG